MKKQLLRLGTLCLFVLLVCTVKAQEESNIKEQLLYSTDFEDYPSISNKDGDQTAKVTTTMYSHETITVSVHNTDVSGNAQDVVDWSKFSAYADQIKGVIGAEKNVGSEIYVSKLASVTKVTFIHGATGSKRGWSLWAKGDGDTDWKQITTSVADPNSFCEVTADVNRTNCELKFTNLSEGNYAYLFKLDIYGKVDMSATPALGSFSYNGTSYRAAEIFTETSPNVQEATIELFNDVELPSETSQLTDITCDNGTITSTKYEQIDEHTAVVSIAVTANGQTVTYKATFVHKPYYTLTYYNTDGNVISQDHKVEKDRAITEFTKGEADVTVPEGQAFRGWFVSADGGEKYTKDFIVTSDISLYAVATDIEEASTTARYTFDLTDKYFYDEDHEAFNAEGEGTGFHDTTHGWTLEPNGKIDLLVGGHAYIIATLCRYSKSDAMLTLTNGNGFTETVSGYGSTDGKTVMIEYTGGEGTLTLTASNEVYLHKLVIANVEGSPVEQNEQGYYIVRQGDGGNLLTVLDIVNSQATSNERTYIFVPDGTYDLGNEVLTPISGDNISIIGQSMDNTIIVNKAPEEGISVSATFLITGSNTYLQDLTLQNAYDYYQPGFAGRAVVIQDKGNRTICKNVKMLSYQDTYYSNNKAQFYFEDSDIHGTVDFICGGGDVFFKNCTLTVEPRSADGSGECTITAPSTDVAGGNEWGYVFSGCTIDSKAESFNYGRAWNDRPRCAYLNTTLLQPDRLVNTRWTTGGMNVPADKFVEYNTMDANGNVISPESLVLTFTKDSKSNTFETILKAEEAAEYDIDNVFKDWTPDEYTVQKELSQLKADDSNLTWDAVDRIKAYAVFYKGEFVEMTNTPSYTITDGDAADYTVRAANEYGGFGKAASTTYSSGINSVETDKGNVIDTAYYSIEGTRVNADYRGLVIKVETTDTGKLITTKLVK